MSAVHVYKAGSYYAKFNFTYNGGQGSFTIQSVQFPGVFLRMDGTVVDKPSGPGAGAVNCQYMELTLSNNSN